MIGLRDAPESQEANRDLLLGQRTDLVPEYLDVTSAKRSARGGSEELDLRDRVPELSVATSGDVFVVLIDEIDLQQLPRRRPMR